MVLELKIVDTTTIDYKINEMKLNGSDKLTIVCQRNGEKDSEIVQVPINNIHIKYSSYLKEPRMQLEIHNVVPIGLLERLIIFCGPLVEANIEVPQGYQGILQTYVINE